MIELDKLLSNSVHLIVTSPPYNVGKEYGIWKDNLSFDDYFSFTESWLRKSYRVLVNGGRLCLNIPFIIEVNGEKRFVIEPFQRIAKQVGFLEREIVIWIKSKSIAQENLQGMGNTAWGSWNSCSNPYMRSICEVILIYSKEQFKLEGEVCDLEKKEFMEWTKNVWLMSSDSDENHPAIFPEELPKRCIKLFSYVGNTVLDPFAGTFTTIKVARDLGRNSIGIEINPEFVKIGKNKIGYGQQTLFDKIEYEERGK